jgi:CHAT domain-containing protein
LYDLLFGDLPELARAQTLYVSPDGPLNFVPFPALRTNSGRYLIQDHVISYVTGATAARGPAPAGRRILVIGNPDGSLPAAEAEARAIASLPGFEPARPLLRSAATLENVRARLTETDFVHFATHAAANLRDVNFGYLQLANEDRVYSIDLGGLSFSGKHVFLSACETRLSQVQPGEDVYGIADAFLAAGASSVIGTLWRVEDESCALFAQHYYSLLANARSAPAALALAARDCIDGKLMLERGGQVERLDEPRFWAGFTYLSATPRVRSAPA